MHISESTLRTLQQWAALELQQDEAARLRGDLETLVTWLQSLPREADDAGHEAAAPFEPVLRDASALRADTVVASLPAADVLRRSPDHSGEHLRVPRVIERST